MLSRALACVGLAAVSANTAARPAAISVFQQGFAQRRDDNVGDERSIFAGDGDVDEEVQGYYEEFLEG